MVGYGSTVGILRVSRGDVAFMRKGSAVAGSRRERVRVLVSELSDRGQVHLTTRGLSRRGSTHVSDLRSGVSSLRARLSLGVSRGDRTLHRLASFILKGNPISVSSALHSTVMSDLHRRFRGRGDRLVSTCRGALTRGSTRLGTCERRGSHLEGHESSGSKRSNAATRAVDRMRVTSLIRRGGGLGATMFNPRTRSIGRGRSISSR